MFIKKWQTDTSANARSAQKKMLRSGVYLESVRSATKTSSRGRPRLSGAVALPVPEPVTISGHERYSPKSLSTRRATGLSINGSTNKLVRLGYVRCVGSKVRSTTSGLIRAVSTGKIWKIGGNFVPDVITHTTGLHIRRGKHERKDTIMVLRKNNTGSIPFLGYYVK